MGPHEETMLRNAYREGLPVPDRIANKPELQFGLYFYLQAFLDLNSERPKSMGAEQIPNSKVREYAAWCECDDLVEYRLLHHIRLMDSDFMAKQAAKQKREADKAKRDGKSKRPRKAV